jgi:hypothetical protein
MDDPLAYVITVDGEALPEPEERRFPVRTGDPMVDIDDIDDALPLGEHLIAARWSNGVPILTEEGWS